MPFYPRKKTLRKRMSRSTNKRAKVSKPLRQAIQAVVKKQVETKTINVPRAPGASSNTVNTYYLALSGNQYLAQDVFSVAQGVEDSTVISAPNRIGDKIQGVGFLMDYYFTAQTYYPIGATSFFIPYVKLRVTVFKNTFGTPLLTQPLVFDSNFLATNTSTLQPINWGEGYVKDVLYDKVFIIRNNLSQQVPGGGTTPNIPVNGNILHFRKYIKYPQFIKFADNNSSLPNATDKPIYVVVTAEVDDANTGLVPSGTKILAMTGYTRAWFKDA